MDNQPTTGMDVPMAPRDTRAAALLAGFLSAEMSELNYVHPDRILNAIIRGQETIGLTLSIDPPDESPF